MSKSEITLRTDATFGLKIKSGDKIQRGQYIGTNRGQPVTSSTSGTVKNVHFDSDNHKFLIVISPAE